MNKYLLLRDNKQSGPYTVPEIIEIGIKPYDLVWLEGKSAAWRYPSEIEELKAHSPSVEEQPFDRFYKTREAVLSYQEPVQREKQKESVAPVVMAEQSPYEPKVSEQLSEEEIIPRKKVYINFPVNSKPEIKAPKPAIVNATIPVKDPTPLKEQTINSTFSEQNIGHISSYATTAERLPVSKSGKKNPERKMMIYAAAAACVILLGLIAVLMINNSGQKKRLQELNTIVRQIQDKNVVTQVKNVEPAPAPEQSAETIINPELLKLSEAETPPQTEKKIVQKENTGAITPAATKRSSETPAVVTAEGNGRPVLRRSDNAATTSSETAETKPARADAAATENLFRQVNIQPGKYKVGMLGGISNLTLAITNNSNRELHKVVVQIKYLGPEKKVVNTQTVYFENVAPGAQSTIDVPKSKRGVTIDYTITDIKS